MCDMLTSGSRLPKMFPRPMFRKGCRRTLLLGVEPLVRRSIRGFLSFQELTLISVARAGESLGLHIVSHLGAKLAEKPQALRQEPLGPILGGPKGMRGLLGTKRERQLHAPNIGD